MRWERDVLPVRSRNSECFWNTWKEFKISDFNIENTNWFTEFNNKPIECIDRESSSNKFFLPNFDITRIEHVFIWGWRENRSNILCFNIVSKNLCSTRCTGKILTKFAFLIQGVRGRILLNISCRWSTFGCVGKSGVWWDTIATSNLTFCYLNEEKKERWRRFVEKNWTNLGDQHAAVVVSILQRN